MLFRIKLQHLRLNRLPDLENILRMVDSFFRADVADMNHALYALSHLHERAKLGEAHDRTIDRRPNRKHLRNVNPGIT